MSRYTTDTLIVRMFAADNRTATRKDVGQPALSTVRKALSDGTIRHAGRITPDQKDGEKRGRPADVFKLTSKGTNRAKKLAAAK